MKHRIVKNTKIVAFLLEARKAGLIRYHEAMCILACVDAVPDNSVHFEITYGSSTSITLDKLRKAKK